MGSGHKTLLYGNAILLRHANSNMVRTLESSLKKDSKMIYIYRDHQFETFLALIQKYQPDKVIYMKEVFMPKLLDNRCWPPDYLFSDSFINIFYAPCDPSIMTTSLTDRTVWYRCILFN